ncbi:MAG TPA: type II toxin-antitoxin system VapC family toxin [Pirellulales bacterium]|nr:type II toxin-antitoxin system VapC family toxin [Pirellulales bacterium]
MADATKSGDEVFTVTGQGRLVLDCSIAVAWCFPDEKAPYPQAVLDSLEAVEAVVPSLWPLEVANALLVGERRKRSTQADTTAWLEFLKELPIVIDDETAARAPTDTLNLARAQNLSSYDAAYLELALRLGAPLATLDDKLKAAAAVVGVKAFAP